jgi:hypothetical protein
MIVSRGTPLCSMPLTFWNTGRQAWIVPLSVIFSARRDELWGRFFNLRRIVNPPAALVRARHGREESPTPFAACRYAGQDGILRATQRVRRSTGAGGPAYKRFGRVTNRPQVKNLPHSSCRISGSGKSMWYCAFVLGHLAED